MNYKLALMGFAALATTAAASPASAMPNGLSLNAQPQNGAEQVRYVCDWRGHCWWRPGPRFYGAYAYGPRWHRGYGPRPWGRAWHRW